MASITLCIDIGGSKIKGCTLDEKGQMVQEYSKLPTPHPATPENVMQTIQSLFANFTYDRISAGFPGYVRDGMVYTAPNLGSDYWHQTPLAQLLTQTLGKPARVVNDADLLGLGCISGLGFEMMITLGTGFGTAFYLEGKLLPHLEMGQHPIHKAKTYDEYVGQLAYDEIGKQKWLKRMQRVLDQMKTTFNYDRLYIGGGNARKLALPPSESIIIVTNLDGIDGGLKLWQQ